MYKYDLIIAGTGFASTFFLKKYLQKASSSARILVLERGFLYTHANRLSFKNGTGSVPNPNMNFSDSIINRNADKEWRFQVGFGGGSNCWFGCTPRFLPNDFRMNSMYGIGNDWPLDYNDLADYYTEAEEFMSVSGPEETPFPKKTSYPQPPHLLTEVDKILKAKYGNLYINQPTARARIPVNGRNACCASATCSICPVNAKFTIENSNMGVYTDPRVDLQSGAQVIQLDLAIDQVKSVTYVQNGMDKKAAAEVVALGANPIFNAHILLNSGDNNVFTGKGLGEQFGIQTDIYLKDLKNVGGSTWVNANGYMLYDGEHRKEAAACLIESSNHPYLRIESGKWRNIASFRMIFEDLPDMTNSVSSSGDRLKPQLNFKGPGKYALNGLARMKEKLPEIFSVLPVEDIIYHKPHNSESHILGTTRMSVDRSGGVVDKHSIHHTYRNCFVLGGGTFPTFTPANPTLTISALSLYAADKSF